VNFRRRANLNKNTKKRNMDLNMRKMMLTLIDHPCSSRLLRSWKTYFALLKVRFPRLGSLQCSLLKTFHFLCRFPSGRFHTLVVCYTFFILNIFYISTIKDPQLQNFHSVWNLHWNFVFKDSCDIFSNWFIHLFSPINGYKNMFCEM
jgi:hypothetical protein